MFHQRRAKRPFIWYEMWDLFYKSLDSEVTREAFNITDGNAYTQEELYRHLKRELGVKTISVRIPRWAMMGVSYAMLYANKIIQKPLHLSPYKVREVTALNWVVDISKARNLLGFNPQFDLEKGVKETVQWFSKNGEASA